jgi:hypothetical protein
MVSRIQGLKGCGFEDSGYRRMLQGDQVFGCLRVFRFLEFWGLMIFLGFGCWVFWVLGF